MCPTLSIAPAAVYRYSVDHQTSLLTTRLPDLTVVVFALPTSPPCAGAHLIRSSMLVLALASTSGPSLQPSCCCGITRSSLPVKYIMMCYTRPIWMHC